MNKLNREVPAHLDVHVILDNLSTHKTPAKQVRLRLVYIDFWSAVKLSFLAAVGVAIVTVVSYFLIYLVVSATGLITKLDEFFTSFTDGGRWMMTSSHTAPRNRSAR